MWVNKISDYLVTSEIVKEEEREIYEFGLRQIPYDLLNLATVLFVGLVTGMLLESILFTFVFMMVRQYAGGYHSSTRIGCYISSLILLLSGLWVIREVDIPVVYMIIASIVSGGIIFFISPVENEKKKLDSIERNVYGRKTRYLLVIFLILEVAAGYLEISKLVTCINTAIVAICLLLLIEKIRKAMDNICVKGLKKNASKN
jgi:accessory gene regulator B